MKAPSEANEVLSRPDFGHPHIRSKPSSPTEYCHHGIVRASSTGNNPRMRPTTLGIATLLLSGSLTPAAAQTCSPTGYNGLTAALVNPTAVVTGTVDATGCDIGVYFNGEGRVDNADIYGAVWYGVMVNGDANNASVDVLDSHIHNIGDTPVNGNQRGIGIYYRAFFSAGTATGRISGNTIAQYQKGGIVANGPGTDVQVQDNTVTGLGPVGFIAQNGIQIGYGASASVMKNNVSENSYTGTSTVSGGIIVVGGPGYGTCPDGNACAYTTNTKIVQNVVTNNDVGVFLTNLADADGSAPTTATNVKAVNNTISSSALQNNYGGFGYQAGISDVGNNDKMTGNRVSGDGYDPEVNTNAYTVFIDADMSFTNRPKVHGNK